MQAFAFARVVMLRHSDVGQHGEVRGIEEVSGRGSWSGHLDFKYCHLNFGTGATAPEQFRCVSTSWLAIVLV